MSMRVELAWGKSFGIALVGLLGQLQALGPVYISFVVTVNTASERCIVYTHVKSQRFKLLP